MDGVCLTSKLRAIERSQCIVHRGLCFEFINIQVSEVKNCADASGGAGVVVDLFNLYSPKFFQLAKYFYPVRKKYFGNWRNKFW